MTDLRFRAVPTAKLEARLLAALREAGGPISRQALADALYPDEDTRPASAMEICSSLVRRMRVGGHPIQSARHIGYWLEAPEA